jgi:hypothetical protein
VIITWKWKVYSWEKKIENMQERKINNDDGMETSEV